MIRAAVYGRLGGDPVPRETRNGTAMLTASLAVDVARAGQDADTEWFDLAAFGKTAEELCRQHKGDLVSVMGPTYPVAVYGPGRLSMRALELDR
jgi:single-strand DNA-binding protein